MNLLFSSLSDQAALQLLADCGNLVYEDRSLFTMAGTPGMPKGSTPTFWKTEMEFFEAARKFGIELNLFPTALWYGIRNGLVKARLLNPGPIVMLALNDLSQPTVSNLIAAIRALLPA